ncbi:sodium/chloride dependent transporter, putative, partial [Ixodes scapularis]
MSWQLCLVGSVLQGLSQFDTRLQSRTPAFVMIFCMFSFQLCLLLVLQNGFYVINILDTYVGGILIPIVALYEVVALTWLYGSHNLSRDLEFLRGRPPSSLTMFLWKFLCPAILL